MKRKFFAVLLCSLLLFLSIGMTPSNSKDAEIAPCFIWEDAAEAY